MSEIKRLLEEELVSEINELGKMNLGSDEYKTTVDGIGKLLDRVNESEKIQKEVAEKEAARMQEAELEQAKIAESKKSRWTQVVTTGLGLLVGAGLTIWGTVTSIEFEKEGTITTSAGKNHIRNLFSKK